ncbi:hypothetical protein SAMN05421764_11289 [Donghicola eburneus]|jgi:hypothetical protein|nr:hypothetical protein SAMN05421764_11289 [Donghicola eburneus]
MTERLAKIINPCWQLHAGPAQATCADQVPARFQTAHAHSPTVSAWRLDWEARVSTAVKNVKRPAEIAVASTAGALSP